jgi:hypothetical protein
LFLRLEDDVDIALLDAHSLGSKIGPADLGHNGFDFGKFPNYFIDHRGDLAITKAENAISFLKIPRLRAFAQKVSSFTQKRA